jgi:hypothetical protein
MKSSLAFAAYFILLNIVSTQGKSQVLPQADYVIITASSYVNTMLPLAAFRTTHNGLVVKVMTTDSIYLQFGQSTSPDSAIRRFVTYALTTWEDPKPKYFLLAGNINAVPSHKEPGLNIPPMISEDSIMVDQWFVEGVPDTLPPLRPAAALGRFPAWTLTQLQTMVMKTIDYENLSPSSWMSRAIAVADYTFLEGTFFEQVAASDQSLLASLWPDTVTVHIRLDSPLHRDRIQFRDLWNQGASIINLYGHANSYQFSNDRYFTTWDVDSLSNSPWLPFFIVEGDQHFEKPDTLCMAVNLLQIPSKGAVAAFAPCGLVYSTDYGYLTRVLYQQVIGHPRTPIGESILATKRFVGPSEDARKHTLFGDPALILKNRIVADVPSGPGIPTGFTLNQNYPNPFNPETNISFDLPGSTFVTLKVFNLIGQEVATLVNGQLPAGTHNYRVGSDKFGLTSGVYFYRISAGDFVQTRKMVLLR